MIVDGFELKFIKRTQEAERRHQGQLLDTIPVTWAKSWRQGPVPPPPQPVKGGKTPPKVPREAFVEVRCQEAEEAAKRAADPKPFVVAVAVTKDPLPAAEPAPDKFGEFRGVFEVSATGVTLSPLSFEAKVLRRLRPDAH